MQFFAGLGCCCHVKEQSSTCFEMIMRYTASYECRRGCMALKYHFSFFKLLCCSTAFTARPALTLSVRKAEMMQYYALIFYQRDIFCRVISANEPSYCSYSFFNLIQTKMYCCLPSGVSGVPKKVSPPLRLG